MTAKLKDIECSDRYNCFIVFEPASLRVHHSDILLQGEEVQTLYDELTDRLVAKEFTIKEQILHNRLSKVGNMLELIQNYENVIVSRFFDKIWRRYSYISHLGENFLDLDTLIHFFPEKEKELEDLIAQRYDDGALDFDEEGVADDEDTSEKSKEVAKDD